MAQNLVDTNIPKKFDYFLQNIPGKMVRTFC